MTAAISPRDGTVMIALSACLFWQCASNSKLGGHIHSQRALGLSCYVCRRIASVGSWQILRRNSHIVVVATSPCYITVGRASTIATSCSAGTRICTSRTSTRTWDLLRKSWTTISSASASKTITLSVKAAVTYAFFLSTRLAHMLWEPVVHRVKAHWIICLSVH